MLQILVDEGQGCCWSSHSAQYGLRQRTVWFKMPMVLRLRDSALEGEDSVDC